MGLCRAFAVVALLALGACSDSRDSDASCAPAVTGRSRAEMIPAVTVPDSPSGEPTAMAVSPTWTVSAEPSLATGRPVLLTLMTARS